MLEEVEWKNKHQIHITINNCIRASELQRPPLLFKEIQRRPNRKPGMTCVNKSDGRVLLGSSLHCGRHGVELRRLAGMV